ncbi:MAG: tetratricopeptide repeat protein [Bacteroidetes bacterium]|nr:tetratricopeptide repeat protein [Bacteroidota bacterium]
MNTSAFFRVGLCICLLVYAGSLCAGSSRTSGRSNAPDSGKGPSRQSVIDTTRINKLIDVGWNIRHNDPELARTVSEEALELATQISFDDGIAWALRNLAVVDYIQGNLVRALDNSMKSRRIFQRLENADGLASSAINIGLVYWKLGESQKAIKEFSDAVALEPGAQQTMIANGNLGLLYSEIGQYDRGRVYTNLSLRKAIALGDRFNESVQLNNLGWIEELQGNPREALRYYLKCLEIREGLGDKRRLASCCASIGSVLKDLGRYDESLQYFQRAMALNRALGEKIQIQETYQDIARMYEAKGDFRNAYQNYILYAGMKDSVMNELKAREIVKMEASYLMEKTQQELQALRDSNRMQQILVLTISSGLLLVLILTVVLFRAYRSKSQINDELRATQQMLITQEKLASLGQLTAGIAHEMQNPMNFINNFAQLSMEWIDDLENSDNDPEERLSVTPELRQNIEKIIHHGKRVDGIIRSMMMHARTSTEGRQAADINALLLDATQLASHGSRSLGRTCMPQIETEIDTSLPTVRVVPQDISRVFLNILNNAIDSVCERAEKENPAEFTPTVHARTTTSGRSVVIRIRDNGKGIPVAARDKIFEPFFTTKSPGHGTGLGLSISYDIIVQKHGGMLDCDSHMNDYTEFTITLPLG